MINRVVDAFALKLDQNDEVKFEKSNLLEKKGFRLYGFNKPSSKKINRVITGYLTDTFNKVIDESHYPENLKVSKVVPIFKDGDSNEPNIYRPIYLIPLFGKIFEKISEWRLMSFLLEKNLSKKQFGFLSKRSKVDALTEMLENIQRLCEENVRAHCTLLEL